MGKYLVLFLLLNISCTQKKDTTVLSEDKDWPVTFKDTMEYFCDSVNFGQFRLNKIEIYRIKTYENNIVKVLLYEKLDNIWKVTDSLILDASVLNDLDAKVTDFNNDNFKDIVFTTGDAARGGNVVQTLLLFSPINKSLQWIRNSEQFPNLMYNEKLDCVEALILSGGQTTYFLDIENDSLKEFASVDQRDGRISVKVINKKGKWEEIQNIKDTIDSSDFDRFIDYSPIQKRK